MRTQILTSNRFMAPKSPPSDYKVAFRNRKDGEKVTETITKGCKRVLKDYDAIPFPGPSQSKTKAAIGQALFQIVQIYDELRDEQKFEDEKIDQGRELGLLERELGVRFIKLTGNDAQVALIDDRDTYNKLDAKRVIFNGIVYAVKNSKNPSGRFDQVFATTIETLKGLRNHYSVEDNEMLSAPST